MSNCFECQHSRKDHENRSNLTSLNEDMIHICWECAAFLPRSQSKELINMKSYHKFEDNLDYVERIAKNRNLI